MDDHEREQRRRRMAAREDQRELERSEGERTRATRTLHDALADWAQRGTVVEVSVAGGGAVGVIRHLGASVLVIERSDRSRIVLAMDGIDGVAETATSAAVDWTSGHPGSVLAALRQELASEARIELTRLRGDPVRGRLLGVSSDMVELARLDGRSVIVPIRSVVALEVIERRD